MNASKLYQESRERSRWVTGKLLEKNYEKYILFMIFVGFPPSKYTMKEQLEMLAEKQGKIERKRS